MDVPIEAGCSAHRHGATACWSAPRRGRTAKTLRVMRGRPSPAARGRTPRFWGLAVPDAQKDSGLMVVVHVGEEASSDRRGRDGV